MFWPHVQEKKHTPQSKSEGNRNWIWFVALQSSAKGKGNGVKNWRIWFRFLFLMPCSLSSSMSLKRAVEQECQSSSLFTFQLENHSILWKMRFLADSSQGVSTTDTNVKDYQLRKIKKLLIQGKRKHLGTILSIQWTWHITPGNWGFNTCKEDNLKINIFYRISSGLSTLNPHECEHVWFSHTVTMFLSDDVTVTKEQRTLPEYKHQLPR